MNARDKLQLCYRLGVVSEAARVLVSEGVLKPDDFQKCIRVWVKKHPEISEAMTDSLLKQSHSENSEP